MASQLPTSTSLLTSPTNFQGIPISQLLAALYGDTTTPSAQYAQPVMHSSSASFRKGIDPRNRPKAGGESEAARGSRLIRERRAREAARKGTDTAMRVIGGMTGGTLGTKPAQPAKPAKPAAAPKAAAQPAADRRYDAAEAARSGARTMGAPSSTFRAPEATPVSRTFDDPTLRPDVAAAMARTGTASKEDLMRATPEQKRAAAENGAGFAFKYALGDVDLLREGLAERRGEFGPSQYARASIPEDRAFEGAFNRMMASNRLTRERDDAAEMARLESEIARRARDVYDSDAILSRLQQEERDRDIATIRGLPTGMAGNLRLSDVERAVLSSPQVLGRVAYDAARPALRYGQDVGSIFLPSIFGERGFGGYR